MIEAAMRPLSRFIVGSILAVLAGALARTSALADGALTVHVLNDTADNVIVTLYDRNLRRHQKIISGQVIYGDASIATSITADASGQGHVFWTAATTDRDMRHCGRGDRPQVNDGQTIHVKADGPCSRNH
jgi:hypothetical protein